MASEPAFNMATLNSDDSAPDDTEGEVESDDDLELGDERGVPDFTHDDELPA
jgi:hypothetical protein